MNIVIHDDLVYYVTHTLDPNGERKNDIVFRFAEKDAKVSWIWLAVWLCGMICWAFAAHIIAARQKEPLVIFGFLRQWGFSISCSAAFMYYHLHKEGKISCGFTIRMGILSAGFQTDGLTAVSVDRQLALTGYGIWMYRMLSAKGVLEHTIPWPAH